MLPDRRCGTSVLWTPRLEPPHPHSQSRHLFLRILEEMKSTETGKNSKWDHLTRLPSSAPSPTASFNLTTAAKYGLGLQRRKPDLVLSGTAALASWDGMTCPEGAGGVQQSPMTCHSMTLTSAEGDNDVCPEGSQLVQRMHHSGAKASVIMHGISQRCDMPPVIPMHAVSRSTNAPPAPKYGNMSTLKTPHVVTMHGNSQTSSASNKILTESSNICESHDWSRVNPKNSSCSDQAALQHCDMLKQKDASKVQSLNVTHSTRDVEGEHEPVGLGLGMERKELEEVRRQLEEAQEVAMTLVYSDGSSQLRRPHRRRQQSSEGKPKACSVSVAYPVREGQSGSSVLRYANFPLASSDTEDKTQCALCSILVSLLSRSRVITYKGHELVSAILSHFDDITLNVWKNWCPMDLALGAWLLDPDHTPSTFSELLARYGLQQMAPPPATKGGSLNESALHHDLALLGPLMVKVYRQLQSKELLSVFLEIESKLIPILAAMSTQGLKVNCTKLIQFGDILKAAGRHFHLNSTSQLREILFDELHLDDNRNLSKTHVHHHKSTSEAVLTQLSHLHPLPKLVLEYRHLCKINATHISGIMPHIHEGILRPEWLQTGAATGRLVACNPNIQTFPRNILKLGVVEEQFIVGKQPMEVEINVREVIESRQHFTFLAADFKSIELRVLAHLSNDAQLLSAFNSSQSADIFITLASEWLGLEACGVSAAERERTKHVVYAVIYGVGKERLGEIMKESPAVAKELTNSFLARFPGIQKYISETVTECRLKGYLNTLCCRRRWFPQISSAQPHMKAHAERQAVNFPVQALVHEACNIADSAQSIVCHQTPFLEGSWDKTNEIHGSAADICKLAMIEVIQMLAEESPRSRLLVQIHDELLFEIPDEEISDVSAKIKNLLESVKPLPCKLKVPLEVRVSSGKTWATLIPISS